MAYQRPWCSYEEQLELLKSRGMVITDEAAALSYLERIGYYRLSGYFYSFRIPEEVGRNENGKPIFKASDQFAENTHFVDVVHLYLFDKKLRLLLNDALERIEISLRVDIAHLLGERSPFAHIDNKKEHFHPGFSKQPFHRQSKKSKFQVWLEKYEGLINRSKEDFIKHYEANHGAELPIWVAVETFDFGAISQLLGMMNVADQKAISNRYGVPDWRVFNSWVYSLSYLRNLVAHHSRLWNRNITSKPKVPKFSQIPWCNSLVGREEKHAKPFFLIAITRMFTLAICPNTEWHTRLKNHLDDFPELYSSKELSLVDMGVTDDWREWWCGQ